MVNSLLERLLAGFAASALIPFIYIAILKLTGESAELEWFGIAVIMLFSAPLFLTAGLSASIIVDWLVWRWTGNGAHGRALLLLLSAAGYAAAGFVVYGMVSLALFGRADLDLRAAQAAWFGIPAGLVYLLALSAIRHVADKLYIKKFAHPVETGRLRLLPLTEALYERAAADGYVFGNHVKTYIHALRRHPRLLGWGVWLVQLKETGAWIGDAGFKGNPDGAGEVDIGYGFLQEHRGRGYATEAADALVTWAFQHGAWRVTAETLRDNAASIRVLHKVGFRLERTDDHYYWSISAESRLRRVSRLF